LLQDHIVLNSCISQTHHHFRLLHRNVEEILQRLQIPFLMLNQHCPSTNTVHALKAYELINFNDNMLVS